MGPEPSRLALAILPIDRGPERPYNRIQERDGFAEALRVLPAVVRSAL